MKIKVNHLGLIDSNGNISVDPPNATFNYPVFNGLVWSDNKAKYEELTAKLNQPEVPEVVFMRQARLALLEAGLLDNVNAVIAALPEPMKTEVQIEWEYAAEVRRDWPTLLQIVQNLGLSNESVDNLFILANTK